MLSVLYKPSRTYVIVLGTSFENNISDYNNVTRYCLQLMSGHVKLLTRPTISSAILIFMFRVAGYTMQHDTTRKLVVKSKVYYRNKSGNFNIFRSKHSVILSEESEVF